MDACVNFMDSNRYKLKIKNSCNITQNVHKRCIQRFSRYMQGTQKYSCKKDILNRYIKLLMDTCTENAPEKQTTSKMKMTTKKEDNLKNEDDIKNEEDLKKHQKRMNEVTLSFYFRGLRSGEVQQCVRFSKPNINKMYQTKSIQPISLNQIHPTRFTQENLLK